MAIRYFIKYFDTINIEHRFNIYDDSYIGDAIQVDGNVKLTYAETDDPLEAIRGQGLSVELEANKDLTFSNLWSEEQKTFKVEYKRNNITLFNGWLNPEGFFESYVDTDWIVTFDCVDGLGYLKDLSFVNYNGFPITGRKKYIDILSIALQRTGLFLGIYTDIQIRYNGLDENLDILNNVYANTDRYVKDDGETIMSCDEVIRDVLEPFGASLTMFNNKWYIYKQNQLYINQTATFYKYTYLGEAIGLPYEQPTIDVDTSLFIGSDWKGAELHHCNGNQQVSNVSSIGAYRINYKYGLVQSLLKNYNLTSYDGITIPDFDIISMTNIQPLTIGGLGITFDNVDSGGIENLRTEPILISGSDKVDLLIKANPSAPIYMRYRVYMSDLEDINDPLANIYYLTKKVEFDIFGGGGIITYYDWGDANKPYTLSDEMLNGLGDLNRSIPSKPLSITGNGYLFVSVYTPRNIFTVFGDEITYLSQLRLSPSTENTDLKGEFHTVQRTTKPSAKVEDSKTVATGDNIAEFYEGTIYKTDTITATEYWTRKGFELIDIDKPLLQVMGEETMRLSQLPSRVFSGDVFGYFNYLSTVSIDGFNGFFIPIEYSYDTKLNIITSKFRQIYGDEINDIDYKKTFDYGNTTKPTIKG